MSAPPAELKGELRSSFLFESLTDEQLDWLVQHGTVETYDPGVNVYEQGFGENGAVEIGLVEVRSAEVRPAEVRPAEVRPAEVRPAEVRPIWKLFGFQIARAP